MPSRHCPYCNSTAVTGMGALLEGNATTNKTQIIVEMRCQDCGQRFVSEDRRVQGASVSR